MVGKGVLLACLERPEIESILLINRKTVAITHEKITEILQKDFQNLSPIRELLKDYDACYFCLGVSSFRMKEREYNEITYRMTLHLAKILSDVSPKMSFCYVSGVATDSTEKGKTMWARVKGKTENAILKLPFKSVFLFRPGFIRPENGIKSKTPLYNTLYNIAIPLYPIMKLISPNSFTTNSKVGKAMIASTLYGSENQILHNKDINELAAKLSDLNTK